MGKVKGLISEAPSAFAVVAATGAVWVSLVLVISNCYGVDASSPSLNGGAGEGRPFFSHDDVAENTNQPGSLGALEVEESAVVNHSARSPAAHRRSSSPSSSLAAGSSLLPKSLGPVFLAASALLAATSLFGLGREARRGGGASGRGVEEGNVEELLRTAGVGTAAGLPKSLVSKNVLFSLTALGLLFLASSLAAAPSSDEDAWDEVKVKTHYDCTPTKCTLKFYNGPDGVKRVYRVGGERGSEFPDLELVLPPEYELYLEEPDMKHFIKNLFLEFSGEDGPATQGSGVKELSVPLPWGVKPDAFFKGRAKKWGSQKIWLHYECKDYPWGGCTLWYPNSAGKNAAVKRIIVDERPGFNERQVVFTAMLPPAFGAKTKDYLYLNVITALDKQSKRILSEWQGRGRGDYKVDTRVDFPIPPNLTPEIFDEAPTSELTDSQDSMEIFAVSD